MVRRWGRRRRRRCSGGGGDGDGGGVGVEDGTGLEVDLVDVERQRLLAEHLLRCRRWVVVHVVDGVEEERALVHAEVVVARHAAGRVVDPRCAEALHHLAAALRRGVHVWVEHDHRLVVGVVSDCHVRHAVPAGPAQHAVLMPLLEGGAGVARAVPQAMLDFVDGRRLVHGEGARGGRCLVPPRTVGSVADRARLRVEDHHAVRLCPRRVESVVQVLHVEGHPRGPVLDG